LEISLFAVLSGEHPTLPRAELRAVLEAEGIRHKILEADNDRIVRFEAPRHACKTVDERASYCHFCCVELLDCYASWEKIIQSTTSLEFESFLEQGENIAVRVKRIQRESTQMDIPKLEKTLGEVILNRTENVHVNLDSPDKLFLGILSGKRFILGFIPYDIKKKGVLDRTPRRKPYFHPSSLQPKLARCMVNFARIRRGKTVLDPFCGTGTVLIEAGLMGIESLGCDIQRKMVEGARMNLDHYGVSNAHVFLSNALFPSIRHVDCIVTDPPYGRVATTSKISFPNLMKTFISKAGDLLASGGYLSTATPKGVELSCLAEEHGFRVVEKHLIYIHRSLTREIIVFRHE